MKLIVLFFGVTLFFAATSGQSYEDRRCICICPSISKLFNDTNKYNNGLFIATVPRNQCNCVNVVLPRVEELVKDHVTELCTKCECKYEMRNTTTIKVVVIIVLWAILLLLVYMAFLFCLTPLLYKKKPRYRRRSYGEAHNWLLEDDEEA